MPVELNAASAFSFLRASSLPAALVERAAALGYTAPALVDRDGLAGAPRFFKAARAAHIPDTGMPGIDWETCMTMSTTWGYSEHDHRWKSNETFIRNLVDISSKGGNYLLNIGPKGDGSVPQESVEAMRAIGAWMKLNRESIVGTTASRVARPGWGRITAREGKRDTTLYLHVFDWPKSGQLTLEGVSNRIRRANLLGGRKITAESRNGAIFITCPPNAPDPVDSVIALTLDGPIVRRPQAAKP